MRARFARIDLDATLPVADAARTDAPVWIESYVRYRAAHPGAASDRVDEAAVACLPLAVDGRVLGALGFSFDAEHRFGDAERAMLEAVARQCAQALDRARLFEAERAAREDLAHLASAGEVLASTLDLETTLQNIVALAMPRLADFGFLDVVEPDGGVRRIARAVDPAAAEALARVRWAPVDPAHAESSALRSGRPAIFPSVDAAWVGAVAPTPELRDALLALAPISMVTVPLRSHGETRGGLTLYYGASGRRHGPDDLGLAREFARRAVAALDNARLFRDVRREERRVRLALDAGRMGAWEWEVATGRVRWSEQVEAIYGVPAGTFGGTIEDYAARLHPDDRAAVLATVERAMAEGVDLHVEHRVVTPDGGVRWVEGRGSPVHGRGGALERMMGVCTDITARKDAEQRLREREVAQRFLAEASAALAGPLDDSAMLASVTGLAVPALAECAIVDIAEPDGSLRRAAVSHVDGARADLVWELARRWPPSAAEPSVIGRAMRTGAPAWLDAVTPELLATTLTDPEQRAMLEHLELRSFLCVPVLARSRVIAVFTLATSDPARRLGAADVPLASEVARRMGLALENAQLYREAREASRLKDEFLATVSHELRTPMTAILGWTAMLPARLGDPDALRRGLAVIERNARAQARLIDDVLDVSRIVTGKLRLEAAPVDVGAVVRAALDAVAARAHDKGVELSSEVADDLGVLVGDADRLQQVVWNLCQNAVKFTPRGGAVTVRARRAGSEIQVVVTDTGQGIAPSFVPHLFERFRQADSSSTRAHGGLGLGLAITRHLVELHGGTVRAESAGEGCGATFTVTLPTEPGAPSRAVESATPSAPPRGILAGLRVLVCDDEADAREIIAEVLRADGATVECAGSALEALARFDEAPPDVLVSDIGMPGEDGYALLRRVRARAPAAGGRTPAVALTAYAQAQDARRALAAGFQRHLTKPVEPARLIGVVANLGGRTTDE